MVHKNLRSKDQMKASKDHIILLFKKNLILIVDLNQGF